MNNINIGILGFGNVGTGVVKILQENNEYITQKCESNIIVKKVLVRDLNKKRNIEIDESVFTTDVNDIIENPEIDIVLELMGGEDFAKECILTSFKNNKSVVSANKMCIAANMNELINSARDNNVDFLFEASVAGGIPIINGINTSLTSNKIEGIMGIMNGTTNYILSKMHNEGCSMEVALKEAQELGYAEADPTSDVENFDAMYKLQILTKLCFGFDADEIYREGITKIQARDIEFATSFGYIIKSLAIAKVVDDKLELRVHPVMLKKSNPLAHVDDSYNSLMIRGNAVDKLMFYGRGAGDLPTGSAVVSDLIQCITNKNNNIISKHIYPNRNLTKQIHENHTSKFFMRITILDEPGVLSFITGELAKNDISVRSIVQYEADDTTNDVVLITHRTSEGSLHNFLETAKNYEKILRIGSLIRIEN